MCAKVILLFALLGTALAFRTTSTLSKAEENTGDLKEMQENKLELALQQEKAELMLTYDKIAQEHAEVYTCMQ